MRTFFNRKQQKMVDLKNFDRPTVSTLLVPKDLVPVLDKLCFVDYHPKTNKKIYNLRGALNFLLNKYRAFLAIGYLPFAEKPKLTYQDPDLDLQRFSFRSNDADWFELGILAYGCGVSRCWLFAFLLSLEMNVAIQECLRIRSKVFGVTTPDISRPRLIQQVFGKRRYIHRILHFRL